MDKTLLLLCGGLVVCVLSVFAAATFFSGNRELMTSMMALMSGFSGAIFLRVKPE